MTDDRNQTAKAHGYPRARTTRERLVQPLETKTVSGWVCYLLATGVMSGVPVGLAQKADDRAQEIFMHANRFGKTFKECLGEVYMVAVLAGVEAAMLREQRLEDVTND